MAIDTPLDLPFDLPSARPERDESEIARTRSILENLRLKQEMADFRGSVSGQKYSDNDLFDSENFADRLIRESAAKQAEPEKVARHIRRSLGLLEREQHIVKTKNWSTAYVPKGWASESPRTVFGTDAWISERHGMKPKARFVFKTPFLALPCVERLVRKEVLFAKKKAGRGYRKRHRMTLNSLLGC